MKPEKVELLKLTNSEGDMVLVNKGSQAHDDYVAKGFADKKAEQAQATKTTRKPRARKKADTEVNGDE